jgi:hypothetical protein
VRRLSFDLDCRLALPAGADAENEAPVYICGLARSGTTLLLRLLSRHEAFQSLSYRAMPFVLAPNLWALLAGDVPAPRPAIERAHGDGVLVDDDSVEAFEEAFWRTFDVGLEDTAGCYGTGTPDAAAAGTFAQYRMLVANPARGPRSREGRRRRYLSKNNNNLVRLTALCADSAATVLVMFRDPVATARSLHQLHLTFCDSAVDPFVQDYMRWLGHREFGPGHLPFCFARPDMAAALDPSGPDYWLDYWTAVYRYVLTGQGTRLRLVDYDALCQSPVESLARVFSVLDEQTDIEALAADVRPPPSQTAAPPVEFREDLIAAARQVHAGLTHSAANILAGA